MTMVASPQELHDAILSNSSELVNSYLKDGADPNVSPRLKAINGDHQVNEFDKVVGFYNRHQAVLSPLHVAIINCYHHRPRLTTPMTPRLQVEAKDIVDYLLRHGADPASQASAIYICNARDFVCKAPDHHLTPVGLAVFFKQHLRGEYVTEQADYLDRIISKIRRAASTTRLASNTTPTVPVAKSVVDMLENMLFSDVFSDVIFVCANSNNADDEAPTLLHAHMCVLAASSSYFRTYFQGHWAEAHPDGRFQTCNSEVVMRVVLDFIYTGTIDDSQLAAPKASNVFSVAKEYDLPGLIALCETSLIRQLTESNVKDTLQLAHLHGSSRLQQACFDFVKRNSVRVLMNPSMMSLATEDSELWAELGRAIDGGNNSKRARTS